MSLQAALDEYKAEFVAKRPAEIVETMKRGTDDIRPLEAHALKVGDKAPSFKLPNYDGTMVDSAEYLTRGPLVVSFFRGKW